MARGPSRRGPATAGASVNKLNSKGIIAWEVDGVLARLTKGQSGRVDDFANIMPMLDVGVELARAIRKRVQEQGELGDIGNKDSFAKYGAKARYPVSQQYAQLAGAKAKLTRYWDGQEAAQRLQPAKLAIAPFKSAAQFHELADSKPRRFTVTGGMWQGLQARGSGQSNVILDFQGSSPGAGNQQAMRVWAWRNYDGTPKPVEITLYTTTPANVRNSEKATMVAKMARVHVLRPRLAEITAIAELVAAEAEVWAATSLQLDQPRSLALPRFGGDTRLRAKLAALI